MSMMNAAVPPQSAHSASAASKLHLETLVGARWAIAGHSGEGCLRQLQRQSLGRQQTSHTSRCLTLASLPFGAAIFGWRRRLRGRRPLAGKSRITRWQTHTDSTRIGSSTDAEAASQKGLLSRWSKYWTEHRRLLREASNKGGKSKGGKEKAATSASASSVRNSVPWKRLLQEFRKEARLKYLIPATILSLVLTIITATRAHLTGRMLDLAAKRPPVPFEALQGFCITYFVIAGFDYVFDVVRSILFASARWDMSMSMRQKVFANVLVQEQAFFDGRKAGELTSRLNNDVDQMQETLNRTPEKFIVEIVRLLTALTIMFRTNVMLTLVSVVPLPFVLFLVRTTAKVVGLYGIAQNDAMAKANRVSDEALRNSRTVQAHAAVEEERKEYRTAITEYLQVIRHTLFSETVLRFTRRLLFDAGTDVPLFCLCVILMWKGELSVGSFYTYRFVLFSYRRAFNELTEQYTGLRRVQAVSQRYFELLDRTPQVRSPDGAAADTDGGFIPSKEKLDAGLSLEFDNVSFAYGSRGAAEPEDYALRNVSFTLQPGEVVAIVGHSGAGKSTLARLCLRFHDPVEGVIRLGGVDLKEWNLDALRRAMGVVDQEPVLFDRSMRQNIGYGLNLHGGDQASDFVPLDDIRDAAKTAAADDFIMAMPQQYDSFCGERGSRLSGGQRQRVTLARALVRKPQLLLLDEHSSSLDAVTEATVTAALESGRDSNHRSTLLIAHRLSTVRAADRIMVLEYGELVEQGSHDELMAQKASKYRTLVSAQVVQDRK
mmetsp:Transcript_65202/g.155690  ORF Transcript_65202/g.155690 Transcript_65202/m.155690 type:complete len:773 (+) Transcript_65202:105-2423(+)